MTLKSFPSFPKRANIHILTGVLPASHQGGAYMGGRTVKDKKF